jgi:hypothetical protein
MVEKPVVEDSRNGMVESINMAMLQAIPFARM